MTELPEPLRLANWLEQTAGASSVYRDKAAAELRRMHRELQRLTQLQMQPCAGRNCGSTNPNLHSAECFEDYEKATGMAQPEQEQAEKPWVKTYAGGKPNYTVPEEQAQPRKWQGLTDEEIKEIIGPWGETPIKGYTRKLFDLIEVKLKDKNHG